MLVIETGLSKTLFQEAGGSAWQHTQNLLIETKTINLAKSTSMGRHAFIS